MKVRGRLANITLCWTAQHLAGTENESNHQEDHDSNRKEGSVHVVPGAIPLHQRMPKAGHLLCIFKSLIRTRKFGRSFLQLSAEGNQEQTLFTC